jgi:hypothetical protein
MQAGRGFVVPALSVLCARCPALCRRVVGKAKLRGVREETTTRACWIFSRWRVESLDVIPSWTYSSPLFSSRGLPTSGEPYRCLLCYSSISAACERCSWTIMPCDISKSGLPNQSPLDDSLAQLTFWRAVTSDGRNGPLFGSVGKRAEFIVTCTRRLRLLDIQKKQQHNKSFTSSSEL